MNSDQNFIVVGQSPEETGKKYKIRYFTPVEAEKMAQKLKAKVVYKKDHTKVFDKKLGCYVDDYPLNKYLIKNSAKIISYVQVKENLYAIIEEKGIEA